MLFQLTTQPPENTTIGPKTAGWSESFWFTSDILLNTQAWINVLQRRASMLPQNSAIVGHRFSRYEISGNRLIPKGSVAADLNYVGSSRRVTDVPSMCLQLNCTAVGKSNRNRVNCVGIPDSEVVGGEYAATAAYQRLVEQFTTEVLRSGACFLGRDMLAPTSKIASIDAGVVTLDNALAGAVVGSYLRLSRVRTSLNLPLSGAFRVAAVAGTAYTLQGLGNISAERSGTARLDLAVLCQYESLQVAQIRNRKVGRPSKGYRGRSSRRRAA